MKTLRKEEFIWLQAYENNMYTAYEADYSRPIGKNALEEMKVIYERLTEDKSVHISCSRCVLKMLKALWPFYLKKKKIIDSKEDSDGNETAS